MSKEYLAKPLLYNIPKTAERTPRKQDAAASSPPSKLLTQSLSLIKIYDTGQPGTWEKCGKSVSLDETLAVILSTLDRILNKMLLYVHFNGCNIPVTD